LGPTGTSPKQSGGLAVCGRGMWHFQQDLPTQARTRYCLASGAARSSPGLSEAFPGAPLSAAAPSGQLGLQSGQKTTASPLPTICHPIILCLRLWSCSPTVRHAPSPGSFFVDAILVRNDQFWLRRNNNNTDGRRRLYQGSRGLMAFHPSFRTPREIPQKPPHVSA